ncbi:MAG: 5'-nucleotidase C-terminal domain-containing protein, partial [Clostridia bacterium]
MKYLRRLAGAFLALLLLLCFAAPIALATPTSAKPTLLLLFTHDTHDHFLQAPMEDGGTYGGYTRLATALRKERAKAEAAGIPVVTLDAGDFSMGSLFQTIYATDAPELRALGLMGYDVTTFGNHEYDYRAQGLAAMLHAAKKPWLGSSSESPSFDRLPAIVQANYKPKPGDTATQRAWDSYPVTDYILLERGGLKIAVFGVLGVDADACAPMSNMHFEPIADAAKRVVAALEAKEQPDYIICLSHAGTDPNPKGSEDELLAKAVPGIDVIISGHTHSVTKTPLVVNNTFIVSCGAYTENLGALTLSKDAGTASLTLLPIDETLDADPDMVAMAETFKALVEARYLADYGMKYDEVLATTPFDFTPIRTFGATQAEDGLGNLISDAYLHAVKEAEGTDYVPVDFAVVASGVVRASFPAGNITVSDAFNVSPLGV